MGNVNAGYMRGQAKAFGPIITICKGVCSEQSKR